VPLADGAAVPASSVAGRLRDFLFIDWGRFETVETGAAEIGKIFQTLGQKRDDPVCRAPRIVKPLNAFTVHHAGPIEFWVHDATGEIDSPKTGRRIIFQGARREISAIGSASWRSDSAP
jgi:hypothetical protein